MTSPYGQPPEDQPAGKPLAPNPEEVNEFHRYDDLDNAPESHHHTLGIDPNQASPGDHNHDGRNSKLLTALGDFVSKTVTSLQTILGPLKIQGEERGLIVDYRAEDSRYGFMKYSGDHGGPAKLSGSDMNFIHVDGSLTAPTAKRHDAIWRNDGNWFFRKGFWHRNRNTYNHNAQEGAGFMEVIDVADGSQPPSGTSWHHVIIGIHSNPQWSITFAKSFFDDNTLYMRRSYDAGSGNTGYGPWKRILTEEDLGMTVLVAKHLTSGSFTTGQAYINESIKLPPNGRVKITLRNAPGHGGQLVDIGGTQFGASSNQTDVTYAYTGTANATVSFKVIHNTTGTVNFSDSLSFTAVVEG